MTENNVPKVFISYSWESEEHSDWVKSLADKLLADGIEAIIDSYNVSPGDRLPKLKWGKIKLNRNSFITFKGGFYEKY